MSVYSQNPSSASMDVLNSNDISDFWTQKTFRQTDAITADIWARDTHDGSSTGNPFSHWENCPEIGYHRKLCIVDVSVGSSLSITAVYDDAAVEGCTDPDAENFDSDADVNDGSCKYQAVIDNFSLDQGDPDIDFEANPPELHVDDQPFTLVWSTEHADSLTASGDWNGPKSTPNGSDPINEGSIPGTSKTFSYTLTAYGSGGNDSATVDIKLLDPPSFEIDAVDDETNIDGEPGSSATNQITLTSHKYNGDVSFKVKDSDIPAALKDDDGNSKIYFTFSPSSVNTSGSTTLNIEILQPSEIFRLLNPLQLLNS